MNRAIAPRCAIDHLVVISPELGRGVRWLAERLGVEPGPGGSHARMGTHNRLMRLQDELYLEVIAPDPLAPAPGRPRWFGLDDLASTASPRLAAWVVRTDDLDAARQAARMDLGEVEAMSRGPWSWRITIPADGRAPLGGLAPALIEWPADAQPASRMHPSGVRLTHLALHHEDPEALRAVIDRLGLSGSVTVVAGESDRPPFLRASFETPSGLRHLSADDASGP